MESITVDDRSLSRTKLTRWNGVACADADDVVAVEEPLEIQLAYGSADARHIKSISVTMRTPGDDLHLAAGFLLTEGVVRDSDDIVSVGFVQTPTTDVDGSVLSGSGRSQVVRVELAPDVTVALATLERNFYTTSSCGICGKASLLALQTLCPPRAANDFCIAPEMLQQLPDSLRASQVLFQRTGGVHGAALFRNDGTMCGIAEDVGRHNAVDKLLGAQFLAGKTPLRDSLLMLSGRCSFELMQKALMAGIPAVAAVGAPSSLAVQVARHFRLLLIGFVRGETFNVYSGPEHVRLS